MSLKTLKEKIPADNIGFNIRETMSGTHEFTDQADKDGTYPIRFTVEWGPNSLIEWMDPFSDQFLCHPMSGRVTVGNLCHSSPLDGYMKLRYCSEGKIHYAFHFEAGDKKLRFKGEKCNLRPWNLHRTHTTLHGKIYEVDTETLISKSILYFYWIRLPSMIRSFNLDLSK